MYVAGNAIEMWLPLLVVADSLGSECSFWESQSDASV